MAFDLYFAVKCIILIIIAWTIITAFANLILTYLSDLFELDPKSLKTQAILAIVVLVLGLGFMYVIDCDIGTCLLGVRDI